MAAYYTRSEARELGQIRYFTGKPCINGHVSERFVSTKGCCECNTVRNSSPELRAFRQNYYAIKYVANRDEILLRGKDYNRTARGRDSTVARTARRRARKVAAEGSYGASDVAALRARQKDACAYCGVLLGGHGSVDHIVALSKGGTNWPANLQLLCRSCNSRKHTKDAAEFERQLEARHG